VARYVLDSSVFIEAHKRYYAPDICPGFWDALAALHAAGEVVSLDRVRDEIDRGQDWLKEWCAALPESWFADSGDAKIVRVFAEAQAWVAARDFLAAAKAKFATDADGWLPAFARVQGITVVTEEGPSPHAKNRVPLLSVCDEFGVRHVNTFAMLRELGIRLVRAA
jgi:hypothetical protein